MGVYGDPSPIEILSQHIDVAVSQTMRRSVKIPSTN
jgi:hypothetical protein